MHGMRLTLFFTYKAFLFYFISFDKNSKLYDSLGAFITPQIFSQATYRKLNIFKVTWFHTYNVYLTLAHSYNVYNAKECLNFILFSFSVTCTVTKDFGQCPIVEKVPVDHIQQAITDTFEESKLIHFIIFNEVDG